MPKLNDKGIFQLKNGYFGVRYCIIIDGQMVNRKRTLNLQGEPMRTKTQAIQAKKAFIERDKNTPIQKPVEPTPSPKPNTPTIEQVYNEYCANGRTGKAYTTIKKQDSLWNNHIKAKFGNRPIDAVSVAEVNSFLETLYFKDGRAYAYVEGFLKMFYLIFGQAYSRNYLSAEQYSKLCQNKSTKISMPKRMIDDEQEIVVFDREQIESLNEYFTGTNAETAYLIGKYCGLRVNECYGLKWDNIDFKNNVIHIEQQMQYQNGVVKLVSLKTRNAKRDVIMSSTLRTYLLELKQRTDTASITLSDQREQNQTMIVDKNGHKITSLLMVNSLLDGKMQTINSMKYHAQQVQAKCGFKFKYHWLRHTYGTNLALLNTPMHILSNQMGHSGGHITQQYYLGKSKQGIDLLQSNLELFA